jgi:hypothetical protein
MSMNRSGRAVRVAGDVSDRPAMNGLERAARHLWRDWGGQWARFTVCGECGEPGYCGARRRAGPYLCLACFDVSREAARAARRAEMRTRPTS